MQNHINLLTRFSRDILYNAGVNRDRAQFDVVFDNILNLYERLKDDHERICRLLIIERRQTRLLETADETKRCRLVL